jgi:hypothetical protein
LKGWRLPDKFDFETHGKVSVRDGEIHLEQGSPATGISYTEKTPRDNYEVSLEAKRVAGNDFFCGLTFPVADEFCTLIVGGWGGGVVGLSNVDGMSAVENETTSFSQFEKDRWYKIRVRVSDERIQAWLDDEEIIDLKRKDRKFSIWWEQEPVRPLGIATWNTSAALRKITLRPL